MIASLNGKLVVREAGRVVIEASGVGYEVFIPLSTYYRLPPPGTTVALAVRQVVREDSLSLYGFYQVVEKQAFDLLVSVQHVGPKLALAVLSVLSPAQLAAAVIQNAPERIDAVPGVGPKVAERIVRELRQKVGQLQSAAASEIPGDGRRPPDANRIVEEAISALVNLGYKAAEAKRAVDSVAPAEGSSDLEDLLRRSLKALANEF